MATVDEYEINSVIKQIEKRWREEDKHQILDDFSYWYDRNKEAFEKICELSGTFDYSTLREETMNYMFKSPKKKK